jgi:hypothetical protein
MSDDKTAAAIECTAAELREAVALAQQCLHLLDGLSGTVAGVTVAVDTERMQ